jgi:sodium-coupled neutral amino acid transporter 5
MNYTTSGQAALNLVYSMINAGFVCLPFAAIHMGFPFFGGIILFMTIISGYTSCILVEMADDKSVRTFEELGEKAFGTKGYLAVCFMEILYSFILMCM